MILYSFRVMSYPIDIALFSKMSPLLMSNLIRANMIMAEIWIVIQGHLVLHVAGHMTRMQRKLVCRNWQERRRYAEISQNLKEEESYQLSISGSSLFLRPDFNPAPISIPSRVYIAYILSSWCLCLITKVLTNRCTIDAEIKNSYSSRESHMEGT